MLYMGFFNASDTPENAALRKQALELCVTDACRNNLRQRIDRSRF